MLTGHSSKESLTLHPQPWKPQRAISLRVTSQRSPTLGDTLVLRCNLMYALHCHSDVLPRGPFPSPTTSPLGWAASEQQGSLKTRVACPVSTAPSSSPKSAIESVFQYFCRLWKREERQARGRIYVADSCSLLQKCLLHVCSIPGPMPTWGQRGHCDTSDMAGTVVRSQGSARQWSSFKSQLCYLL